MTPGLQRAWVTSPALPSAELHFSTARHYASGAAVVGTMVLDIFKILELPLCSHGLFSGIQTKPHGAKPQLLSMTTSILGFLLLLSLHLHQWPLLVFYGVKPQLLSLHDFKIRTIWETFTLMNLATKMRCNFGCC